MKNIKVNFRTKVFVAFLIPTVFLFVLIFFIGKLSKKIENNDKKITGVYFPSLEYITEYENLISSTRMLSKLVVIDTLGRKLNNQSLKILINNEYPELKDTLLELSNYWNDTLQDRIKKVFYRTEALFKAVREVMNSVSTSANDTSVLLSIMPFIKETGLINESSLRIERDISFVRNNLNVDYSKFLLKNNQLPKENKRIIQILVLIFIVLMLVLSWFFYKHITTPIFSLKKLLEGVAEGKLPDKDLKLRNDEIGEMGNSLKKLIKNFRETAIFAKNIGEKNYNIDFEPLSEEDELGKALIVMRDNLKKADEEEKQWKKETERRNWITNGLAKFSEILRNQNDDLSQLGDVLIRELVHYVDANLGAIYLHKTDEEGTYLETLSVYAYDRKKYISKKIMLGEGLVGTCALEKERIFLTDIPEDYVNISSGLGASKPRSVLLIPLKFNEEIYGVIELASLKVFEDYQIEFVEKLSESIASTLNIVSVNMMTKELLEQSQQQAEELATQEEEMRQNLEELQATQEELSRKRSEMESIFTAIKESSLYAEFDKNGKLIDVSDNFYNFIKLDKNAINSVNDFLPENAKDVTDKVLKGEVVKIEVKSGSSWLMHTLSPIYDSNREVVKILDIAVDITKEKLLEEKLKDC